MIIPVLIYMYLLNVLENRNATFERAISHLIKSTILIGRNYLFNYIAQNNYCIIEIFNHSFLKNNIETKDECKFNKLSEKICENFNRFVNTCIKY